MRARGNASSRSDGSPTDDDDDEDAPRSDSEEEALPPPPPLASSSAKYGTVHAPSPHACDSRAMQRPSPRVCTPGSSDAAAEAPASICSVVGSLPSFWPKASKRTAP